MTSPEEKVNKARGYKAAMHNPHVSEEAKEHSRQALEELEGGKGKDPEHVARGLKAATHNPNVSEEAKMKSEKKLEDMEQEE